MPSNTIHDIYQDATGYLWLATPSGLTRFNGRRFTLFTDIHQPDVKKTTQLSPLWDNNIAISTKTSNVYSFQRGIFKLLLSADKIDSNPITALHLQKDFNVLLVGTNEGFAIIRKDSIPRVFSPSQKRLPKPFHVKSFQSHPEGVYIFTAVSGVFLFHFQSGKIQKVTPRTILPNAFVSSSIITSANDTLWAVANNGIYSLSTNSGISYNITGTLQHLTQTKTSEYWFTRSADGLTQTSPGLFRLDSSGVRNMTDKLLQTSAEFTALHFDRKEQKLWIGTRQGGLYCFVGEKFTYYPYHKRGTVIDLKKTDSITALLTHEELLLLNKKRLWHTLPYQTFDSLFQLFKDTQLEVKYYYLNDASGSFEKYNRLRKRNVYPFINPYQPGDSVGAHYQPHLWQVLKEKQLEHFTNLMIDSSGNIRVGTNTGFFTVDPITKKSVYEDLPDNFFTHHSFTSKGNHLSFSWKEIASYNQETLRKVSLFNYLENRIPASVQETFRTDSSLLLFSPGDGVYEMTNDTCRLWLSSDTLSRYGITSMAVKAGKPWLFGTETGEVVLFAIHHNKLTRTHYLGKSQMIPADNILWVQYDADGIAWLGTNKGLIRLYTEKLQLPGKHQAIELFTHTEGFCDYSGNKALSTPTELTIAGNFHVIAVDTKNTAQNQGSHGKLIFQNIYNQRQPIPKGNLQYNINRDTLFRFQAHENTFTFVFDLIQYHSHAPGFEYRLLGLSDRWIQIRQPQDIVYSQLPPGTYKFQLRAIGKPEITPLLFAFHITPPFYTTWYFLSGLGIVLAIIMALVIYYSFRRVKRQAQKRSEIKERIAEFEIKALRAQMNPHFIFNAINSIQNFMLDNDIDSALAYLSDFAKLIRTTLDNASQKLVDLEEEIAYLHYYLNLEQMRFDHRFAVHIIRSEALEHKKILVPPMIIQPYVENAIKHGLVHKTEGAGQLDIHFQIEEGSRLLCIVEDNGIGRKRALEINRNRPGAHKPKGSKITRERLQLLNVMYPDKEFRVEITDKYDNYSQPAGTRAEIRFPLLEEIPKKKK